ncbi:hypothetical protein G6F44_006296 [Rhizopus delemar]|nr:hypothetical protein G6F44_006296 [Rhizopus delemar]
MVLLKNPLTIKRTNDSSLSFCYEFFMIFVLQIFAKHGLKRISKSEPAYNFRAIYKSIDVVVDVLPQCEFIPVSSIELVLLETSGASGNDDIRRETTDYVKAAYGLLALLHTVAYKYAYADIVIFNQLKVCFVHAANDKVRLWAFCLVSKELYVLNRADSSMLPTDPSKAENDFRKSHEQNKLFAEGNPNSCIEQLDTYLVEVAEVKLSSQVLDAEDIHVNSSPLTAELFFEADSSDNN